MNTSWNVYVKMEAKLKIIPMWKPGMGYCQTCRLLKEIQMSLLMIIQVKT